MASPPTSLLASSEEVFNGAKLYRLLFDGGTPALRRVFDGFHPPLRLAANLKVHRQTLERLLKTNILMRRQWDQLFPADGVCLDSGTFDITLLTILLTNICGLRPPRTGWKNKPPSSDTSREANIVRLKYYRNLLSHRANGTGVSTQDFEVYWQEIADALVAFGEDRNAIDTLKAEPGGINVLHKLEMCDFTADIECHASRSRFQEGTRDWVFDDVEDWLDDRQSQKPHQVMAITGDAGMGKTVASAVICKRMREVGKLSASHFCQHNFSRYRNPKLALQSLAFQLSCNLRGYREALVKRISRNFGDQLSSLDVNDLFAVLFKEPLRHVTDPGRNVLIVIDGLDESEDQGKNELLDVIANHFCSLPLWIRLLVTTRPEKKILDKTRSVKSLELRQGDERNHRDIEVFFESRISDRATPEETRRIIRELVQLSEGQMLHAYFLLELNEKSTSPQTPEQLRSSFPQGISAIYTTYFKRMEAKLEEVLKSNCGQFLTDFLSALTATRDPLPKGFVTEILRQNIHIPENDRLNVQRKLDSVISCISSLLPIRDGNVHVFHKSVKEWLTDESRHGSHEFTMLEKDGHRILGTICAIELDKLRANNVHDAPFSDTQKYALRHGFHHMLDGLDDFSQLEELVRKYVTDLELVYAKLCAKNTDVLNELLLVQEHRSYSALSEELVSKIESLQLPFKKHGSLLQDLPHVIFQNLLNEGGSKLSREVSQLLSAKHLEIPYMELLDKSEYKSPVKARFYCSDKVVCFDVSPDGKHMVCECRDGKIHLWSLQTGHPEWQRVKPWESKKAYDDVPFGTAFRRIGTDDETGGQTLSFYRSTVFHPNGQYILPGNMANVYNLRGQPTSLFPESNCRFTACAFSGDKNRMLTDCPASRKEVVVWNTESGTEIKRFKSEKDINSFAFSPDGNLVTISDSEDSLWLYNIESSISAPELVPAEEKDCVKDCGLLHITTNGALVCGRMVATLFDSRDVYKLSRNVLDSAFVPNRQPHCTRNSKVWLWPWESVDSLDRLRAVCKVYHHFVSSELMIGFCFLLPRDVAVVGGPTVNYLTMVNVPPTNNSGKIPRTMESTFKWDAKQVYTTVTTNSQKDNSDATCSVTISVRDVDSARVVRAEKRVQHSSARVNNGRLSFLVEKGVLLQTTSHKLELWNCDLSKRVKPLTMPSKIERLIPVSKELVGCLFKTSSSEEQHSLTISTIDVSSMEVVSKRVLDDRAKLISIACSVQRDVVFCNEQEGSDKCQLVLYKDEAQMFTWKKDDSIYKGDCYWRQPHCLFSPNGQVVVTWNTLNDGYGLHVLMAGTGRKSHVFLENQYDIADCKFLNDGESVVCHRFNDSNVWMFNVASGLVLAVIDVGERPTCIGSSPNESLIAVGLRYSNVKLIRAQLPR